MTREFTWLSRHLSRARERQLPAAWWLVPSVAFGMALIGAGVWGVLG